MIPEIGCPDCDIELNINQNENKIDHDTKHKNYGDKPSEIITVKKKSIWYFFWYALLGLAFIGIIANVSISGFSSGKIEPDIFKDVAIIVSALFAVWAHQNYKSKFLWGIIGLIVGVAITFVVAFIAVKVGNKYYAAERAVKAGANQLKSKLPIMLPDGQTKMIEVEANGKVLQMKLKYTNYIKNNSDYFSNIMADIKKDICNSSAAENILKEGAEMKYIYVDDNNAQLGTIFINKSECGK